MKDKKEVKYKSYSPSDVSVGKFHGLMLGAVAPRPIAFASTVDAKGNVNLSPFSFFNAFGANPATLVFSPARRVRDNTTKHTLENVKAHPEVVINIVDMDMVQQMSLASTEYDQSINEFVKAGFTELPSELVQPPRVAESPASFECRVIQVVELGQEGGAGNLIICEVMKAHFKENIFTDDVIDPLKLNPVARMGGNWYSCLSKDTIFEVEKPVRQCGVGVDQIPLEIRESEILTGNDLGKLGNVELMPSETEISEMLRSGAYNEVFEKRDHVDFKKLQHSLAQVLLNDGRVREAWKVLLAY